MTIKSKYPKYASRNPISRFLVKNFLIEIRKLVEDIGFHTVIDVGCGEGHVLNKLGDLLANKDCAAIDFDEREVLDASANLPFCKVTQGSIYSISHADRSMDLVICCEVLEHLEAPDAGLDELYRVCARYAILSVPNEPIWRILNVARMTYLKNLGNTPNHLNHWTSSGFERFVARRFSILRKKKPLPWTVILAEKKNAVCR